MAENPTLAFLQQALSVSGANAPVEETALYNLFMQRLIVAGMTIDASGNITAPFVTANPNVTNATGTLAVGHGGTGAVTLTSHGVVVGAGVSAVSVTAEGATNTVLHGNTGAVPTYSAVVEADITLAANTTNDVSTARHGFAPILPNDVTKFLDGTGAYTVVITLDILQIEAFL